MRTKLRLLALSALLAMSGHQVGAVETVKSRWLGEPLKVDGTIDDWPTLTSISKEVAAAAANDAEWLYLAVTASDPAARQRVMTSGLIVYLDPTDKKKKTFGVRIPPLGARPSRGRGAPDESAGATPRPPSVSYVEVLGPGKDETHIVNLASSRAIQAAAGENAGVLLIELAVPLSPSEEYPYSPGLAKGGLGLGLVTPDPAPSGRGDSGRTGMPPGGGGAGGMGGGMGRGGGMGGGGMPGQPGGAPGKALNAWATIELARQ